MKKIFAIILCAMLMCTPLVASASEVEPAPTDEVVTETENVPTVEENATEVEDTSVEEVEETLPEKIVSFITENYTGSSLISLAVTVVVYLFYEIKKHKALNGSIGVLNNNAVEIAENSAKAVKDVLDEAIGIADVVKGYKDEVAVLLEDIRKSAEEKQNLEETLHAVKTFLATSKLATMELANEVADLLVLANIPNAKKEELYSRHRAAVDAISTAEKSEEMKDDGKEA